MSEKKVELPVMILLRCVGTPVVGPCNAVIEVPAEAFASKRKTSKKADETSWPLDGVTWHLFKNARWIMSALSRGQGKSVFGPMCLVCSKKAYPAELLKAAYEHLEKLERPERP